MNPIKTNESNFTYLGPQEHIADLPCRTEGDDTFSIWQPTREERRMIAEGGHIRLGIYGVRRIPPISLQAVADVGPYKQVSQPCDKCGEELGHEGHESGPGNHPFRSRGAGYIPQKFA